ncbi:MAG: diguanylate cyclase [Bradyrhizobium sp.]|uniref:GGDEF domain-containing protein n=1 Tax=Bradyrhizobium sp. TaxID=376 RepID=UPI00271B1A20|nr:sensor domain-containing diguanylate cyclase [Bradyrhizobium sp.]MDO8397137.1 diguanylate cyclase [Bradyrhizobium sp.]
MSSTLVEGDIAVAVIDALTSQICVVDPEGVIFAVNRAWKQFTAENSPGQVRDHIGVSYLNVCRHSIGPGSEEALDFANGLRAVLRGEREFFQIEYPCHSAKEIRWFLARVSPLRRRSPSIEHNNIGAVVSHMNITDRKLAEMDYARLASTDQLTGLPNRRFFDEFAKLDMDRFLQFGEPSSLLMVDLDHFKTINDTYGHAAGDEVLRRVAALGKLVFRSCDLFIRWGGEEFVCLLPRTDEWGAILAAEKLRSAIEQLSIFSNGKALPVTASIGVASIDSTDQAMDSALLRADRALYRAKECGRNRVRS